MRFPAFAALWVVMVVGCGNVNNVKPDAGETPMDDADVEIDAVVVGPMDYAITVGPTSLTLPIASSATVDVTITRNNFSDTITLSAVNVPAGVNVTFDPPTLAAGVDTSVATVAINGGIAEGAATITIDATSGLRLKSATVSVDWHMITVSGKVQNGAMGITVVMPGRTPITTPAGGAFTFTNVTPPYDLYTVADVTFVMQPTTRSTIYYKGLTRTDPIVSYATGFGLIGFNAYSASLSGSVSGHPGYANTWVGWGNNNGSKDISATPTAYSALNATWPMSDGTVKNGSLHALTWNTTAGQTSQIYYGTTTAQLNNGVGAVVNVSLAQSTTATLTGTITPPGGFGTPTIKVFQNVGLIGTLIANAAATSVNTLIPVIAAGKSTFSASASGGGGTSAMSWPELDANTDVSFTLLDPPALQTPANAGTASTATDFTFTAPANHVHVFSASTSGATRYSYTVYTHDTTVRIPTVSQAPLPAGQTYTWSVQSYGPGSHVNAVATETGPIYPGDGLPSGPRRTYTSSASRTFTSQ